MLQSEQFYSAGLFVRSYRQMEQGTLSNQNPPKGVILFVHGATIASVLFDLPVPGYSLMQAYANDGWWTFACDLTGYGNSVKPAAMTKDPSECSLICTGRQALIDIEQVTKEILKRTGQTKIHLVGGSWGSLTAARFAIDHADLVERLILIAPLFGSRNESWLATLGKPNNLEEINPKLGGYRFVDMASLLSRWDPEIPAGQEHERRDPAVLQAMFQAELAADPLGATKHTFRVPNGTLHDLHHVFLGRPLYEPERLNIPCLLIRGEQDQTSTQSDMALLYKRIGSADKHMLTLPNAGHFIQAERNAPALQKVLLEYLR
jgi:pimeloyl-ACP methyl ester carboxylesterase